MPRPSFGSDATIAPGEDFPSEASHAVPSLSQSSLPSPLDSRSEEARVLRVFSRNHLKSSPAHAAQIEQVERLHIEFEIGSELQRQHLSQAEQRQRLATEMRLAARKAKVVLAVSAAVKNNSKDDLGELIHHSVGAAGGGTPSPIHIRNNRNRRSGSFIDQGHDSTDTHRTVVHRAESSGIEAIRQNFPDSSESPSMTPSKWNIVRRKAGAVHSNTFGDAPHTGTVPTPRDDAALASPSSVLSGGKLDVSKLAIINIELEQSLMDARKQLEKEVVSRAEIEEELMALKLKFQQNEIIESQKFGDIPINLAANFLPNSVINFISNGERLTSPKCVMMEDATLLFLDISGYTKLAEKLGSSLGSEGTEILSKSISTFFETAILMIYSHGGDVVKFCGDALMCTFSEEPVTDADHDVHAHRVNDKQQHSKAERLMGISDDTAESRTCSLAMQCALKLMEKLRFFVAAEGVVLDLKIMLGKGTLVGNYVGSEDLNHWEYLLTGRPFEQITEAEHYANPGDIVVSSEVWKCAGNIFEGTLVPSTNHHLLKSQNGAPIPLPSEKPQHLWFEHGQIIASLIEPGVLIQIRDLHGAWTRIGQSPGDTMRRLSKHENCSTMFIMIKEAVNDTRYAEECLKRMQVAFQSFYKPMQKYGGMLRQFLLDDKGLVAILVFTGKESNATYACRCAVDVRAEMSLNQLDVSIGISSGRVFCGPVGCPYRCEYAFVGDSVNLAARLMCNAATGVIVADRLTADGASRAVQFRDHGQVMLKGKSGKIPTFEVLHVKSNNAHMQPDEKATEEFHLTSDGKFDNLAPCLPSSILDIVFQHCTSKPPVARHGSSTNDFIQFRQKSLGSISVRSPPRMAVCVAIKFHPHVGKSRSVIGAVNVTLRSSRSDSQSSGSSGSEGLSAFAHWVEEVRASALDHGGDVISVKQEDFVTVVFFTGEFSVRHYELPSRGKSSHVERKGAESAETEGYKNTLENVARHAIGFIARTGYVTQVGVGIGCVFTILSQKPFSGAYTHFGDGIDEAQVALSHSSAEHANICSSDKFRLLVDTGFVAPSSRTNIASRLETPQRLPSAPPSSHIFVSFALEDMRNSTYINPGLCVSVPYLRRYLSPEQVALAVTSIQSVAPLPLTELSNVGQPLFRITTEHSPSICGCAIVRSRLCLEANSAIFGQDPNAALEVQNAIDDAVDDLHAADAYLVSCEVFLGEVQMIFIFERDFSMAILDMIQVHGKLSKRHPDTSIFISTGDFFFSTNNGLFYAEGDCIKNAMRMMKCNDFAREPVLCDDSCLKHSTRPWLVGFRSLDVYSGTVRSVAPSSLLEGAEEETRGDGEYQNYSYYAPFENVTVVADKINYSEDSRLSFRLNEGRKFLVETLKSFAKSQETTTVLLEGERGMGKSRVISEFKKLGKALGIRTISSKNCRSKQTNAFQVWSNVLTTLLFANTAGNELEKLVGPGGISEDSSDDAAAEFVLSTVERHLPPEFPSHHIFLINDVLPSRFQVPVSSPSKSTAMTDGERKFRLEMFASIISYNCSAESPLILILEDWQYADSLSWKLLFALQQQCSHHLMIILTASSDDDGLTPTMNMKLLKANPSLCSFVILPLGSHEVKEYVDSRSGAESLLQMSPSLLRSLEQVTRGIPMVIEQLVSHLVEMSARKSTTSPRDDVDAVICELDPFVTTKHQMAKIAELRLNYLSKYEVMVLCIMTTLGDENCSVADVVAYQFEEVYMPQSEVIGKFTARIAESTLKKLVSQGYIYTVSFEDEDGSSMFSSFDTAISELDISPESEGHNLTQSSKDRVDSQRVCYRLQLDSVPESLVRNNSHNICALHLRIASKLESIHLQNPTPHYAQIGHHYKQGGSHEKAKMYFLLAGDYAFDMCAPQEALRLYYSFLSYDDETSLAIASNFETKARRLSSISKGAQDKFHDGGRSSFLSIEGTTEDHKQGHVHRMLGEALYYIGNLKDAQTHFEIALHFFKPAPNASLVRGGVTKSTLRMKLYSFGKLLKIRSGNFFNRRDVSSKKIQLDPASLALAKERCWAWERLTQIHYNRGNTVEYIYSALQNYASAEILGIGPELCYAITQFIPLNAALGHHQGAEFYSRESTELCERIDDRASSAFSFLNRALFMSSEGQLAASLELYSAASQIFESIGNIQAWCESIVMTATVHLAIGNFDQVVALTDSGVQVSLKVDNYKRIRWFLEMKVTALMCLGMTREAKDVMSDGFYGFFIVRPESDVIPQDKEAERRQEVIVPEQARSFAHEGRFDVAAQYASKFLNSEHSSSWWRSLTTSCCAEIYTLSYLHAKRNNATVNAKSATELSRLAGRCVDMLLNDSKKHEVSKPFYLLEKGRLLLAKGREHDGLKILTECVYISDNYSLLPTKARACIEIARNCSKETVAVRQNYAKTAEQIFDSLRMKRAAQQAKTIVNRLKPSMMDISTAGETTMAHLTARERTHLSGRSIISRGEIKVKDENIPLTGRDDELALLMKRAGMMRTERSVGAVVIEGDAGFGKSALLNTFLKDVSGAYSSFLTPLYGNALELEQDVPYHAWAGIMSTYFSINETESLVVSKNRVMRIVSGFSAYANLYPLLNQFLPFSFDETAESIALEPTARTSTLSDMIVALLSSSHLERKNPSLLSSERTHSFVLVVDDAQWCDGSSWALLSSVAKRAIGVFVVVASRRMENELNAAHYDAIVEMPLTERLVLSTLPSNSIRKYLCALLQVQDVSEELLELMVTNACSNLLYVQEAVTSMVENGVLAEENGVCVMRGDVSTEVIIPNSIGAVISSRIERLTAPQQQILCCAAVIGSEFSLSTLLKVHPAPDLLVTVKDDIRVLVQRTLIEPVSSASAERPRARAGFGGGSSSGLSGEFFASRGGTAESYDVDNSSGSMFKFVHKFTQETAYNRFLVSTRRQVHLALAQYIESRYAGTLRVHYGVLADHYYKAEHFEEAKTFFIHAGDTAIECCAASDALKFFTKALDIINVKKTAAARDAVGVDRITHAVFSKPFEEEGHIYRQIGEAHFMLMRLNLARDSTMAALRCFGEKVSQSNSMSSMNVLFYAYRALRVAKTARLGAYMLADDKSRVFASERARAWNRLCQISYGQGESINYLTFALRGIDSAAVLGPSLELSNALSIMIPILLAMGFGTLAESFSACAMKASQELHSSEAIAIYQVARSTHLAARGHLLRSEEVLRSALAAFEGLGEFNLWVDCCVMTMATLHSQGKFLDETEIATKLTKVAEQSAKPESLSVGLRLLCGALLARGSYEEARKCADRIKLIEHGKDKRRPSTSKATQGVIGEQISSINSRFRLAGEKGPSFSAASLQRLLFLIDSRQYDECCFEATIIVDLKDTAIPDRWFKSSSYAMLAEVFAELCRRAEADVVTFHGCGYKGLLGHLCKVVSLAKHHRKLYNSGEADYWYARGLLSLCRNEAKTAKSEFERAISYGKKIGANAIVAKCYFILGINCWEKIAGKKEAPRPLKGIVVGGITYVKVTTAATAKTFPSSAASSGTVFEKPVAEVVEVSSGEQSTWFLGPSSSHYLCRAFALAKKCGMDRIMSDAKQAIKDCSDRGFEEEYIVEDDYADSVKLSTYRFQKNSPTNAASNS